jgi:heme A synthase
MTDLTKAIRPIAGTIFALTLFQGAIGWELLSGTDMGHSHTAYLITVLAIILPVIVIQSGIENKSVKGNAFAVAGLSVIQLCVGIFMMPDFGWLHIPLAMMLAAHTFAVLISMKHA